MSDTPITAEQRRLYNDPPQSHLNADTHAARQGTLWWGDVDVDGLAMPGGTWDFEDGTLQGWTSIDLTDIPARFRRIVLNDCVIHGDPVCPVITLGFSQASLWVGWHEDETTTLCWPGGQGYGNNEGQHATKEFHYGGSGDVTVSYDYFVDSETQFDFTYVYVIDNNGIQAGPFNTSRQPNSQGLGYSGGHVEETEIGEPDAPEHDLLIIGEAFLPVDPGPFEIDFTFDSDPLYSDALDSFWGFFNSWNGPFGVDNIQVTGIGLNDLSTFETGDDNWSAFADPAIGPFMQVAALSDLEEILVPCQCPLTEDGNDFVMVAADISPFPPNFPHPEMQHEQLRSPPAYIGDVSATDRFTFWSAYGDLPEVIGVQYRIVVHYYPWTCPETGLVGWTIEPAGTGGYFLVEPPDCDTYLQTQSPWLPAEIDSIKQVFQILSHCDIWGGPQTCIGPEHSNHSPYWDDIRIGIVPTVNAPPLSLDIWYQDCYPRTNSLVPTETARMYSFYDNNRVDGGDQTNANMGDSTVVRAGEEDETEIYLNYRAYPGVGMGLAGNQSLNHAFFSECGNANALTNGGTWAVARMDTAETRHHGIAPGRYATYHQEGSCGYTPPEMVPGPGGVMVPNYENKILPDGLFTPGTTIEYFFTSNFRDNPEQDVLPDTTGGFYLEVEVLPGYLTQTDVDPLDNLLTPCVLYVDAFNAGAHVPIQDHGLRPVLGDVVDVDGLVHDRWDRYDYLAAHSNVPAPYARELNGDNGATKYQSMVYRAVLWNTGTRYSEGLRDGDADLLQNFLTSDDLGRPGLRKGLWLSGDGMPRILDRPNRPHAQALLHTFAGAELRFNGWPYRDPRATGDSTLCVRLDPSSGRDFPISDASHGSLRGNGCPVLLAFTVVGAIQSGAGNMDYVDQDAGGTATQHASVSNDQFAPTNAANYGLVLDAWSLHHLRATPDGWTGEDCGRDSTAIRQRLSDVFTWFGVTNQLCDPVDVIVSAAGTDPASATPMRTLLLQNTPNPFNPRTMVRYQLAETAYVRLMVFDVSGKVVRTLVDEVQGPNVYAVSWDGITAAGTRVASGVYWARMTTSLGFSGSTRIVVVR